MSTYDGKWFVLIIEGKNYGLFACSKVVKNLIANLGLYLLATESVGVVIRSAACCALVKIKPTKSQAEF